MLNGLNGPTEASWSWEPKAKHGGSCVNSRWTERWNAFLGWWPSDWSALGECYWVVLSLCKWFQIISDSIFTQVAFLGWTHQIAFLEVVHTPQENAGLRWESTQSTQSTQSRGPSPVACWQSPTATWHSMGISGTPGTPGTPGMEKDGDLRSTEVMACPSSSRRPCGEALLVLCCDEILMILIDSMNSNEFLRFWMQIWRVEECMLLFCQVLGEGSPTSSSFRMLINRKAIIWDLGSEAFWTLGEDDYCIICIRKVKERPLKELAELARNPPRPMTAISRRLAKSKNLDTPRRHSIQKDPKGGNAMEMWKCVYLWFNLSLIDLWFICNFQACQDVSSRFFFVTNWF